MDIAQPDTFTLTLFGSPVAFARGRAGAYWASTGPLLGIFLIHVTDGTEFWDKNDPRTFEGWNREYADLLYDDGEPSSQHLFAAAANALHREYETQLNYFPLLMLGDEVEYSESYSPAVAVGREILGQRQAAEEEPLDDFAGERTDPQAGPALVEADPDLLQDARAGLVDVLAERGHQLEAMPLLTTVKISDIKQPLIPPAAFPITLAEPFDRAIGDDAVMQLKIDAIKADPFASEPKVPGCGMRRAQVLAEVQGTQDDPSALPQAPAAAQHGVALADLFAHDVLPPRLRAITDADLALLLRHNGVRKIGDFKALGARLGFGFTEPKPPKAPSAPKKAAASDPASPGPG